MKWLLYGLLCVLLLTFSDAALPAAQNAVSLWLTKVLPALFPFYVASTLFVAGGLYDVVARRCRRALLPVCFLLGAISGYPVGARLGALCGHSSWGVYCNLCSPAFLLGVVAIGMLGDASYAVPLMLAHYGAALLAMCAGLILPVRQEEASPPEEWQRIDLTGAIGDGMTAMLRIGGCIVFFTVCAAVIKEALRLGDGLMSAAVAALLEMTTGCLALSALPLPPRLIIACTAASISFGGLSVCMQALSVAPGLHPLPYLIGKLFQASLSFLIAYAVAPCFCPEASGVFSNTMENLLRNASTLATLLLAASTGMVFAYLFALIMKHEKGPQP